MAGRLTRQQGSGPADDTSSSDSGTEHSASPQHAGDTRPPGGVDDLRESCFDALDADNLSDIHSMLNAVANRGLEEQVWAQRPHTATLLNPFITSNI